MVTGCLNECADDAVLDVVVFGEGGDFDLADDGDRRVAAEDGDIEFDSAFDVFAVCPPPPPQ
jgi:hypothetical protein